jgi:hypothetical protein
VLTTAFDVVRAGKITRDGAATLTHCAVELELWALGQYFGTKPVVGMAGPIDGEASDGASPHLSDEAAHALLELGHEESALVEGSTPTPISTSGGHSPKVAAFPLPLSPAVALKLALWLLKTAAAILL